jgi:hypothetical protein
VHDDFGLLRYVLTPKAQADNDIPSQTQLKELCYYSQYDDRKRMIIKKLPGAESLYMVYDNRDRLVLTQDGKLREENDKEWMFTTYDHLNRPAVTGRVTITNFTFPDDISAIEDYTNFQVTWNETSSDHQIPGYISSSTNTVHTKTYYDDYEFTGKQSYSGVQNHQEFVQGQITGTKTLVLDGTGNNWIEKTSYYDNKYRIIQIISTLYPEGTSRISNIYDFTGNLLQSLEVQNVDGNENSFLTKCEYDHGGRLLNTYGSYNNEDLVLISRYKYNETGELINKKLHSIDLVNFLQSVDFSYNIRGWLTKINDPDNIGIDNDAFGMNLYYEDPEPGITSNEFYNGNISAIEWKTINKVNRGYGFDYDEINRLRQANHKEKPSTTWVDVGNFDVDLISYDLNGNIGTLKRKNSAGTMIDDLTYNYDETISGNKLQYVNDNGTNDGFFDLITSRSFGIYSFG